MNRNAIADVAAHFRFAGSLEDVRELTSGLINNSYRLTNRLPDGSARDYVLQQINTYVFKMPEQVMSNVERVTDHLRRKLTAAGEDPARRALRLIETVDGGTMYRDDANRCWRAYDFICDAVAYDRAGTPEHFREAGAAFGEFQRMLFDFPAGELYETIPHFHDTRKRFETFRQAVAIDRAGRVKDLAREISFFLNREEMLCSIVKKIEQGELPLRVTHNDTKLNNVMLDAATRTPLCVIDLDTVMPGLAANDFGDSIRFGASTALEDEKDLSKVSMSLELYEAYARGFLGACRNLTQNELDTLPLGAKLMTLECGVRFLTDYLAGDTYFRIARPEHNLDRCRTQFKLVASMEQQWGDMARVIREITAAR